MALTNSQFDDIMRSYSAKRLRNEREFRKKTDEAYKKFPRLSEIDAEIAALSVKKVKINLGMSAEDDFDPKEAFETLSLERQTLLKMAGFPDGKAEIQYDCPICRDTGFVSNEKCSCFKQAEARLLYSQSRLSDILNKENFDTFSLDWYSDMDINPSTGLSARETALRAYNYSKNFVDTFSDKSSNICFYGKTGVGKTFLSHCIAKALIDKGVSVLYFTAFDFFNTLEENAFHQTAATRENTRLIYECDLLIIDDLGANMNNSFISSQLFQCINERLITEKSTIISTNLSVSELRDAYSDRVVSRITSSYQRLFLFGDDIRIKKKLSGGSKNV